MAGNDSPFFKYPIDSESYLDRCLKHIERFDNGEPDSLFYAALELRMGIESQLHCYLKATFQSRGMPNVKIKDYVATKLLERLKEIEPEAENWVIATSTLEQTWHKSQFAYIPVTKELARMHGRLGELLHYNIFINNAYWLYKERLKDDGARSLLDFRDFIEEVAKELAYVNRGTLLTHPTFTALVDSVIENEEGANS